MRQILRRLGKNPGFTLITVITLAIGIGANTAIFSVVNAALLRPLPFDEPDRLVLVHERIPSMISDPIPVSAPDVIQFQQQSRTLEGVSALRSAQYELSGAGQPERLSAARVSQTMFPLLRVEPVLGRNFLAEEDQPGHNVAIISHGLWQRQFGGSADAIGMSVNLDRQPFTVVGVMPSGFEFPLRALGQGPPADVWVPMAFTEQDLSGIADNFNFTVLARLRPGATLEQANEEMHAIAQRVRETYPPSQREQFDLDAAAVPLGAIAVQDTRTPLLLLLGAVGLVLLVVCANVANLFLAQATSRSKEMALRLALGAGRWRIVRQLLAESLPLSLLGGLLGLLVAEWGKQLLISIAPVGLPVGGEITTDLRVLGFALALSLVVSVLFAIIPALSVSQANPNDALREGGTRTTAGPGRHRIRGAFVVAEIAMAFVLLTGAGLLVRSFIAAMETDPGFQAEHVLTMSLTLPETHYSTRVQTMAFHRDVLSEIESIPGVESAGSATDLPLQANWTKLISVEGREASGADAMKTVKYSIIHQRYLDALGIRLLRARYFNEFDREGGEPVILINETLAQEHWPGGDPIGKRLKLAMPDSDFPWLTVVGVVGDVKSAGLDVAAEPHAYESLQQVSSAQRGLAVVLRGRGDPADLTSAVVSKIGQLDPELAIGDVRTMAGVVDESMAARRFMVLLLAAFSVTAVLLAAIGIYGVLAHSVTERTHEIGIRVALGAQRSGVYRMIVAHGLKLALIGIVIGLAGSFALTRVLANQLYGVSATDMLTFSLAPLLVSATALVACLVPATRATRVNPIVALRYE